MSSLPRHFIMQPKSTEYRPSHEIADEMAERVLAAATEDRNESKGNLSR